VAELNSCDNCGAATGNEPLTLCEPCNTHSEDVVPRLELEKTRQLIFETTREFCAQIAWDRGDKATSDAIDLLTLEDLDG
jgi:hypothetical protein